MISKGCSRKRFPLSSPSVRQRGVAAIMFVLMLPVLLGFMALGIDGANFLRAQANIGDAVEVTSLALSAQSSTDQQLNDELAQRYMNQLVPDAVEVKASTTGLGCDDNPSCDTVNKVNARFFEYKVRGSATFKSLFPGLGVDGIGFPETMTFNSHAAARKYEGSPVDIAFISDFSLSMDETWGVENKKKIVMLKQVIKDVADQVENLSKGWKTKNSMALVPYALFTGEDDCRLTELITNQGATSPVPYPVDKVSIEKNVDIQQTFDEMFNEKTSCLPINLTIYMPLNKNNRYDQREFSDQPGFKTVPLTTRADEINDGMVSTTIEYGTASFEGIIRGAQVLLHGENPRKLLIVLSDGRDWKRSEEYHDALLNADVDINGKPEQNVNYCDYIKSELSHHNGRDYNVTMAVIGFGYNADENTYLRRCVGAENLYTASDMDDIKKRLLRFIGEETGHLHDG